MDWNQSTMYEQRVRFILEVQQRTFSFAESCRRYGISRTAGYTWWTWFLAEGFEGLHDRSHRPHHCPHAVAEPIVEHVVDLRQRYGWGSRKIRKLTAVKFGGAPARRTIDRIFERHDLITKKRRRSGKPGHPGKPLTPMDEPNMRSGPSTSKVSSRCATAATAIPSPSRTASADSCSSAEGCIPRQSSLPSPCSSTFSASSAFPPSSAPTTGRLSRPSASLASLG